MVAREIEFEQIDAGVKSRYVGQVAVWKIANDEMSAGNDGHLRNSVDRTSE